MDRHLTIWTLVAVSSIVNSCRSQAIYGKPFNQITHVVFDLDGTLIDTESCYKDAANVVTSRYGKEFTWENKTKLMQTNLRENSGLIVNAFRLPLTAEQFYNEVMTAFSVIVKNGVNFMAGAEEIVQCFHSNNITLGLCTASKNDSFLEKVNHFGDFFTSGKYFDVVVVAGDDSDIAHNKPDPEPYLVTISRLPGKPKPENVLVFEDSLDGVASAIAAGAQCIMVADSRAHYGNETANATLVLKSFNDFDPSLFGLPEINSGFHPVPYTCFSISIISFMFLYFNRSYIKF